MTKRLPVIGLLVALGAGLAVYLLLALNSGNGGPSTYARLQPVHGPAALEVWRDTKGRLTFHWLGDHPGEVDRYDPSKRALAEFSDGQALGSTTFPSSRAAWSHIHVLLRRDRGAGHKRFGVGNAIRGTARIPNQCAAAQELRSL